MTEAERVPALVGSRDAFTSELSAVECQAGLSFQYSTAPSGLPIAGKALNLS